MRMLLRRRSLVLRWHRIRRRTLPRILGAVRSHGRRARCTSGLCAVDVDSRIRRNLTSLLSGQLIHGRIPNEFKMAVVLGFVVPDDGFLIYFSADTDNVSAN